MSKTLADQPEGAAGQVGPLGPVDQHYKAAVLRADWTNSLGYNPAIFADRDGSPVNWSIHMNDAKDAAGLWNGSTYQPQPTAGTGTSWHHLAVVFQTDIVTGDSTFMLYWDGKLAGTTTQGLGAAQQAPTEFGSSSVAGSEPWVGGLDEIAFYSYSDALSAARIPGDSWFMASSRIGATCAKLASA